MKKITLERISYYMSAMILFNLFFIIAVFSNMENHGIFLKDKPINIENIFDYIAILMSVILLLWGAIYTLFVCKSDFNTEDGERGIDIKIQKAKDITAKEFFGKFSLLVLTGISIGNLDLYWKTVAYLIFYITIGAIYIRLDMIYLNFLLILFRYKIFEVDCKVNNEEKQYYFVLKDLEIKDNDVLAITNTKKTIIRLKSRKKENEPNDKDTNRADQ